MNIQFLINSVPALIHTSLPDGHLDFFNQPWLKYVGRPLEDLQGWKWTSSIHPDDVEGILKTWRASLASGEPFLYEARVRRADGEYRWMLHHKIAQRDELGNIVSWYGSSIEIEDRKRAEEALAVLSRDLQVSKTMLEEAQHITHVGHWVWDLGTNRLVWSDETYRIFGLRPQERPMDIATFQEMVHPEDRESLLQATQEARRGEERPEIEFRIIRPSGEVRTVLSQGGMEKDGSGTTHGRFGTVQDITDRKRSEEALQQSQFYLAEGQRLAHMSSWAWRVAGRDAIHLSDEWYRVYGFDPKQGKPVWQERLQRVHTDDRDRWRETLEKAIREKSDYDIEFRILLPDGTLKWVHTVGHPVMSAAGELEQFVGSSMDITARKQADEQLKAQQTELRQMLDLAPQLVVVFGPGRERLYANRMTLDYLGIDLHEWRQLNFGAIVHPDDSDRLKMHADRALLSGSACELELRLRKSDGTYRWFLIRYNPLHDETGQINRWYVAATDIEDRKKTEERLKEENAALREEIDKASMFEEIVGTSPALKQVLSQISKVAPSESTVLITGETGTGKELAARAIHRRSARASRPFVSVNCAAIPRDLVASELFGHEKGAFTGATQRRLGRFELAEDGTLFLDEVGELPAETQIALLRVLQEREFERVGGNQLIRANVRVIAATNRDLEAAIAIGSFRRDLFYRLNVFPIEIPPLRERREDIALLVEYFIDHLARKAGKRFLQINKRTLDLLLSYPWPGNIRELQNVIERSVIVNETETFSVDESWLSRRPLASEPTIQLELSKKLAAKEKEMIEAALRESGGRVSGASGAAMKLGIHRSTLESKIASLNINKYRFKTHTAKNR
jgi:PAS domain S-box-containing protein